MKHISVLIIMTVLACPAQAGNAINFNVALSGDNEVPPVTTGTWGEAIIHVDRDLSEIRFKLDVHDGDKVLGAAGSHFHCAPAGTNGPVVAFVAGTFPPGYDGDFQVRATLTDDNIINPACGTTIAELVGSMLDGNVYLNVHSTDHPGGLIRGQVQ
jgi:CHRD domain